MPLDEDVTLWRYLADEAKAGRLSLDASVAVDCRDACNRMIDKFTIRRESLGVLSSVTGLGDFKCTQELATMLGGRAVGGEGDMDSALREHIEVLTLIRDTIQVSVDRIQNQDDTNAQAIGGVEF